MGLCLCNHILEEVDGRMEQKYRLHQNMEVVRNRMQAKRLPVIGLQGDAASGLHSHACNIAERFGYTRIDVPAQGGRALLDNIKERMVEAGDTKGYLLTGFPHNERQLKRFWHEISPVDCIIQLEGAAPGLHEPPRHLPATSLKPALANGDPLPLRSCFGRYNCYVEKINASEPASEVFLRIEATILDRLAVTAP